MCNTHCNTQAHQTAANSVFALSFLVCSMAVLCVIVGGGEQAAEGGEAPKPKLKKTAKSPDADSQAATSTPKTAPAASKAAKKGAKGPVDRAGAEAKAKAASQAVSAGKGRLKELKAQLAAAEKGEKELEKAAKAAKKAACEGQFICVKAITGF